MNGVDAGDYALWKSNFGATSGSGLTTPAPEPNALALMLLGMIAFAKRSVRRKSASPLNRTH